MSDLAPLSADAAHHDESEETIMRRTSVLSASALLLGLGAVSATPAMAAEFGSTTTITSHDRFYAESTFTQGDYSFSDVYSDEFSERTVESEHSRDGRNPVRSSSFQSESKAESWNEITEQDGESFYSTYYGDRATDRVAERYSEDATGYSGSLFESSFGYSWDETTEGYADSPEGQSVDFWENDWADSTEESYWGTW